MGNYSERIILFDCSLMSPEANDLSGAGDTSDSEPDNLTSRNDKRRYVSDYRVKDFLSLNLEFGFSR